MTLMFIVSIVGVPALVLDGRRNGYGARKIAARLLLLGLPLSMSLDHMISGSEHFGIIAVIGSLLAVFGQVWFVIQSKRG
jgi:hypothetical protein